MIRFAGRGKVFLYDVSETSGRKVKAKQMLWGDYLNVVEEVDETWAKVKWGSQRYFVKREDLTEERPLEVIFLDVGQGDSCILTSPAHGPDEKIMIIDAGVGSNTHRYLKYRFGKLKKKFKFHAAIVTHPDQDHYKGFQRIFEEENVHFERVYHNGIAERPGDDRLGATDASGRYLTDVVVTHDRMKELYRLKSRRGRMPYPKLMHTALTNGRVGAVEMLSTSHGDVVLKDGKAWMRGFAPGDSELRIEVLGPVTEPDDADPPNPRLRWFGDTPDSDGHDEGKTKNGHSVLLRLTYRDFSLLFGGDLNRPSETFLLRHYGNRGTAPRTDKQVEKMVERAAKRLRSDMMKCCHHGSSDVTDEFLEAVQPFAFVVSSGDEESHVHPRPDLLGRLGKMGRGDAPLLLCTELLRSTREFEPEALRKALAKTTKELDEAVATARDGLSEEEQKELDEAIRELRKARASLHRELFKRNVGVYGAITLRTDGREIVIAFRKESSSPKNRWQTYRYRMEEDGFALLGEGDH